ncbi:hypothetical protein AKJ16_DCAP11282 [Drosera capensis]
MADSNQPFIVLPRSTRSPVRVPSPSPVVFKEVTEKVEVAEYEQNGGRSRENVEVIKERVEVDGGKPALLQPKQESFELYKYQKVQNI